MAAEGSPKTLAWILWLLAVSPLVNFLSVVLISIGNGAPTFSNRIEDHLIGLAGLLIPHGLSFIWPKASTWIWMTLLVALSALLYFAWVVHQPGPAILRWMYGMLFTQSPLLLSWLGGKWLARQLYLPIYQITIKPKMMAQGKR